ncbi:flagellar biosynthesis protein FlgN [Litorivita sp. NS0012-18]|uniref:flagellar biosynthesis protein FlgN n=1 Tax=Litorivita sp. NS0012-18 TaxID=3127655 RepID=UPI0031074FCD
MQNETAQDLINEMDDLLDKEREALLVGDLDVITRLLGQKEHLIDALNAMEHDEQERLVALQGKVQRNQALLDGALRGIRAVAQRLSSMRRVRKNLDTYDSHGQRQTIEGTRAPTLEKRA